MGMFASVTFPLSSFKVFDYSIPDHIKSEVAPGTCVSASFGKNKRVGFVTTISNTTQFRGAIKPLECIHDSDLTLPKELWETLIWMSRYYITPLGSVLKSAIPMSFLEVYQPRIDTYVFLAEQGIAALPQLKKTAPVQARIVESLLLVNEPVKVASLKLFASSPSSICNSLSDKGFASLIKQPKTYDPFDLMVPSDPKSISLNKEQSAAYEQIVKTADKGGFSPFLLKGVTGSGKTEVYLKLAQNVINQGKSVIVLVPEISLTPQIAKRFRQAFGMRVALWHSRMTKAEKGWTWQQLKRGKYSVVVGARSALMSPIENLGLIIVDEEQELSYKQENPSPRYNARDTALVRGKHAKAIVLLTSATPSLESYYNSLKGKIQLLELTKRFGQARYPVVRLIDMKKEHRETGDYDIVFSRILIKEIKNRLTRKEQVIILQNRRGFSSVQQCLGCGHIVECRQCSVSMTYHRIGHKLLCHYCHNEYTVHLSCTICGSNQLSFSGTGTQRVEDEMKQLFPEARILRMDTDSMGCRGAHYKILETFKKGEADILLGTQMIAKGLDFANVSLVGVVHADAGIYLTDFRAGERIFQLLYQVAGRAGRHLIPGMAIIQSYNPKDQYIQAAAQLDVKKFYSIELAHRNELSYPPFSRFARLLFTGKNKSDVSQISKEVFEKIHATGKFNLLGPAPAPIERIRNLWRYHLIVKSNPGKPTLLHAALGEILDKTTLERKKRGVRTQIDIDPVSVL